LPQRPIAGDWGYLRLDAACAETRMASMAVSPRFAGNFGRDGHPGA